MTLFYLTAKWCGPCRTFGPMMDELASTRPDLDYQKVDIDNDELGPVLIGKYGIYGVPTVLLEKDGAEVARFTGARS